jgi:hypothetical protein
MVFLYYCDFALQHRGLRVVKQGVLGLGLIIVYVYYELVLQRRRFRVVERSTWFRVDIGVFVL